MRTFSFDMSKVVLAEFMVSCMSQEVFNLILIKSSRSCPLSSKHLFLTVSDFVQRTSLFISTALNFEFFETSVGLVTTQWSTM